MWSKKNMTRIASAQQEYEKFSVAPKIQIYDMNMYETGKKRKIPNVMTNNFKSTPKTGLFV